MPAKPKPQIEPDDNRRDEIEKYLNSRNVKWEYLTNVAPGGIDEQRSYSNQARLNKPVDTKTVKTYTAAMEQGESFPPILVHRPPGSNQYVILDGNHRYTAYKELGRAFDVYECTAPPAVLTLIMFEANTRHGLPSSEADRLHHALFLVDNGMSIKDAAAQLLISRHILAKAINKIEVDRRAVDVGISPKIWDRIGTTYRIRIASLRSDQVFKETAIFVVEAGLRTNEIAALVAEINAQRSNAKQLAVIERWRTERGDQVGMGHVVGKNNSRHRRGPRQRLAMALGLVSTLEEGMEEYGALPDLEKPKYRDEVKEAIERLHKVWEQLA